MKHSTSLETFAQDIKEIFDSLLTIRYYQYINAALHKKRKKLNLDSEADLKVFKHTQDFEGDNYIHNSLYINLVAVLETYLQNRLIEELKRDETKIATLVLRYDLNRKLTAQDVINGAKAIAVEIINQVVYHNLKKVNSLYKIVFDIDILPLNKDKRLFEIINVRHNIVHRSGRIAEKKIFVRDATLLNDMTVISRWVENIDCLILKGTQRKTFSNYLKRYYRQMNILFNSNLYKLSVQDVTDREILKLYEPSQRQTPHISI